MERPACSGLAPGRKWRLLLSYSLLALAICLPYGRASAQSNGDALASAVDAFGERVGTEQFGLYDEGQVRGFDLGNTGAYRLDGDYIAKPGDIPDALIEGVGVRVGVNAARLDYPAPSGVVNYRLKSYRPGDQSLTVSTGFRDKWSPFAEFDWRLASKDGRYGVSGGALFRPDLQWGDGTTGRTAAAGLVPEWRPSPKLRVRGVLGAVRVSAYDGDYGYESAFGALPAPIDGGATHYPPWAHNRYDSNLLGLMVDAAPGAHWRLSGSAFYSSSHSATDFTDLEVNPDLTAHATLFHTPDRTNQAESAEVRAARSFRALGGDQQLSLAARARRQRVQTVQATAFDLGVIDLVGTPIYPARPDLPEDGPRSHDAVDQRTFSLGYAGVFGGKLELRAGLHRTTYAKRFEPVAGPASELERSFWLEHGSALWRFDDRTAVFTSYVKGLEDSGIAPQTAVNRGQVLLPVQARQIELGVRRSLTPKIDLIAAVFDVSKPMPGLRADGVYGFVGDVRHRGVELSINGALTPSTQLVVGVMAMRPRISGPLVEAGLVGAAPPGISSVVAVAGLDQTLGFLPGWSLDSQISWESGRWADTADSFRTPPLTQLSLGARYRFDVVGHPTVFRIAASNVLGAQQWRAFPYGAMYPINPPLVRASLTMTFAPPAASEG